MNRLISWFSKRKSSLPDDYLSLLDRIVIDGRSRHRANFKFHLTSKIQSKILKNELQFQNFVKNLFLEHELWDTEENLGILLFISLDEPKCKIFFDRGLGSDSLEIDWRKIEYKLDSELQKNLAYKAIPNTISEIIHVLEKNFPKIIPVFTPPSFPFAE
ncbi:MAG: hypothetical protein SFU98_00435 [Leptospiraceae bacterium]|nr:hypothetical protein [Leptospiraceae bacterium]